MSLAIQYDESTDVLIIEGIRYAGELFRLIGFGPLNRWFKILKREDGVVTLRSASNYHDLIEQFRKEHGDAWSPSIDTLLLIDILEYSSGRSLIPQAPTQE